MSTQTGTDLCRVTLAAPRVRLDVAVPSTVPLASLLPTLLTHVGEDTVEEGTAHGGWTLQRLGESPLDVERTVAALGIRDGEILYLRPHRSGLPTVAFDDPVDAMGHALRDGSPRWTTRTTHTFSLAATGVLLAAGAVAGLTAGPPWTRQEWACGAVALCLIAAAALVSRAFLPAAGTVLGAGATGFAFVGGLLVLAGHRPLGGLGAPQFLVGLAAALVAAIVAAVVQDRTEAVLVGIAVTAALAALGALVTLKTKAAPGAGVDLVLALALTPWLPRIAYRAAGLPQPVLPVTAEELRRHGEPLSGEDIRRRTLAADSTLTALAAAATIVAAGSEFVMLRQSWSGDEWSALAMSAIAVPLLLLRARLFAGLVQRLWLLGGGVAGTLVLAWRLIAWFGTTGMLALMGGLVLSAGYVASWSARPDHEVAAPWARASDIIELVMTLALIPLVLELLGVYGAVRSLTG